jgi:hypothetical protein
MGEVNVCGNVFRDLAELSDKCALVCGCWALASGMFAGRTWMPREHEQRHDLWSGFLGVVGTPCREIGLIDVINEAAEWLGKRKMGTGKQILDPVDLRGSADVMVMSRNVVYECCESVSGD